jgi:hypothetical protein
MVRLDQNIEFHLAGLFYGGNKKGTSTAQKTKKANT